VVIVVVVSLRMSALNDLNLLTILEAVLDAILKAILVAIVVVVTYAWMDHVSVLTVFLCRLYGYHSVIFLDQLHIFLGLAVRSHII
jgi:hypothetical protein